MIKLNKAKKTITQSLLLCLLASSSSFAQFGDKLKDGLKYYIDSKDSSRFIKLNVTNQIWARYTQSDPLTVVNGAPQANITDISIRRIRAVLSGQLNDRVSFFLQFGQNNLNYLSTRKAGAFFHDVTADYAVIKKYLSLGFGLNGWNGPSRFSNISTSSIMVLDPPNFQEVTNDTYDQFVRRLGIYMKGKISKLDYRISVGKPFVSQTASGFTDPALNSNNATFSSLPPKMVYQGYFMWQFLDQESNFGPSTAGTYLGKKRVLNIGAGFYTQQNAMYKTSATNVKDTILQNIMLLSADVFYDTYINKDKGNAFSFYASYSNYNYGTNFIKVTGPDNPATGVQTGYTAPTSTVTGYNPLTGKGLTNFNKASYGNAFPYLGTGNVLYAQAGYKFKDNLLGSQGTLQVYANCQYAVYDRLAAPMYVFDAGVNWLIKGHHSKFTLDYQNRPYFLENANGNLREYSRYGQVVLQYQISF